jgi:hypothetical protein
MATKNITPIRPFQPNEHELCFVADARRILEGSGDREPFTCTNRRYLDIAKSLLTAFQEDGRSGFERSYESLARDNKRLDELRKAIEVPAGPGEEETDPRFTRGQDGKLLLKLSSIEDIYALPDAEYLIRGILEAGAISLLYGVSGTGKTFTGLHLALSIAHGIAWHGRSIKEGLVWYINTEGGRGLKKRLKAWYTEHDELTPSSNFKVIPWSLDLREHYQELKDTIEAGEQPPQLIIIDNFSMCAPGVNQNLQEEVAPILGRLNDLAQQYGCHVMIIHHTNKEGDVNGTMAFRNHVDTMIELKKQDKADRNSPIIFSCQKNRDNDPFSDIRTELKSVTIYVDEETGQDITSCVVVDSETEAPPPETPATQRNMLEILHAHGKLNTSQWAKRCKDVHQISEPTFYRNLKTLIRDELIAPTMEKTNGKSLYYALTEMGVSCLE